MEIQITEDSPIWEEAKNIIRRHIELWLRDTDKAKALAARVEGRTKPPITLGVHYRVYPVSYSGIGVIAKRAINERISNTQRENAINQLTQQLRATMRYLAVVADPQLQESMNALPEPDTVKLQKAIRKKKHNMVSAGIKYVISILSGMPRISESPGSIRDFFAKYAMARIDRFDVESKLPDNFEEGKAQVQQTMDTMYAALKELHTIMYIPEAFHAAAKSEHNGALFVEAVQCRIYLQMWALQLGALYRLHTTPQKA